MLPAIAAVERRNTCEPCGSVAPLVGASRLTAVPLAVETVTLAGEETAVMPALSATWAVMALVPSTAGVQTTL
jgi:hypothetical protein